MKIFLTGATGATGRELAKMLVRRGHSLCLVVRDEKKLPDELRGHEAVTILEAALPDLSDSKMLELLSDCDAAISCLGHRLSLKGMYGQPRRLVADAAERITRAGFSSKKAGTFKFILMSSSGVRNTKADEKVSFAQRLVVTLIRWLVPPHADNEAAAAYLQGRCKQGELGAQWVIVRPDSLVDANIVSEYEVEKSPSRSAIFDPGKTSRINVADFMANLLEDPSLWNKWQGLMPVVYNRT